MPRRTRQIPGHEPARRGRRATTPAIIADLPDEPPAFVTPMQCKAATCLPVGEPWRYELKLDGYRALAVKTRTGVRLFSRNHNDLSHQFPEIANAIEKLAIRRGTLDGEIVVVDAAGKPSFQALQHLPRPGHEFRPVLYFAFDLLNWEGKSLLKLPLVERKRLLELLMAGAPAQVRFAGFLDGDPDAIIAEVRRQNLEGVVAKRILSCYEPDQRSGTWVKFKCGFVQEFVIGGYTRGRGRAPFGALIVGYYQGDRLRCASKVGTGGCGWLSLARSSRLRHTRGDQRVGVPGQEHCQHCL